MYLRFPSLFCFGLMALTHGGFAAELKVCADPDNLPFSDKREEGFENKIVEKIARLLDARITYVWWDDRRALAIEALKSGKCDLVPSTLSGFPGVATTQPYLRSSYAFVTRQAQGPVASFDDDALLKMRVGVQSVGDDASTPPANALLRRGLGAHLRAYTFHGHYSDPNSASIMIADIVSGQIDAAVLWGPFAGYFASRQVDPLVVTLVKPSPADPPMVFSISMAVRSDDSALLAKINKILEQQRYAINGILDLYGVPRLPATAG